MPSSWEFIRSHSQFATRGPAWNVLFLGKVIQRPKMNSWLKPARSGQGEGKSRGMGSPWLESLTLLSSQPGSCSFLFCISGSCLLPHATKNKQANLSQYFQVICQAPALLAANRYLSFQLPRPSSPCQTTFFYTAVPSTSTTSQFVCLQNCSLFLHFISLQRADPRPIEMFLLTSMGFESDPTSLSLPGVLSCLWVSLSSFSTRSLFPSPFLPTMQCAMKPPLLCMAHRSQWRWSEGQWTRGDGRGCRHGCAWTLAEGRTT